MKLSLVLIGFIVHDHPGAAGFRVYGAPSLSWY